MPSAYFCSCLATQGNDYEEMNAFDVTWRNYIPSWRQLCPPFLSNQPAQAIFLEGEEAILSADADARTQALLALIGQRHTSDNNTPISRKQRRDRRSRQAITSIDDVMPYNFDTDTLVDSDHNPHEEYYEDETAGSVVPETPMPSYQSHSVYAARAMPFLSHDTSLVEMNNEVVDDQLYESDGEALPDKTVITGEDAPCGITISPSEVMATQEVTSDQIPVSSRQRQKQSTSYFRRISRLSEFRMPIAGGMFGDEQSFGFFSNLEEASEELDEEEGEEDDDGLVQSMWNMGRKLWG